MTELIKKVLPLSLIVFAGCVVYLFTLNYSFNFDDFPYIVNRSTIRSLSDVNAIWHVLARPGRFVAFYSFALNYHFAGYEPWAFRLTNIFIHIFNGLSIYWFVSLLSSTPGLRLNFERNKRELIALFTALLFVAHPIQTQAVTYIVQRFASLASCFYLLCVCCYLQGRLSADGRKYLWMIFSVIFALTAMFTKQISFTLPFTIMLVEFLGFGFPKGKKGGVLVFVLLGFSLIVPCLYSFRIGSVIQQEFYSRNGFLEMINWYKYFWTQFKVILTYLKLVVFPVGQNLDYEFSLSSRFFELKTFLSFLTLVLIFMAGVYFIKKQRLLSMGIFWMFITLAVESSIIPIPHVIFEHRMYLPMVGVCLFLVAASSRLIHSRRKFILCWSVLIITFMFVSVNRNRVWTSEETLWTDVLRKSPNKSRPYINLGMKANQRQDYNEAIALFNKALSINPQNTLALTYRAIAYSNQEKFQPAMADFTAALSIRPTEYIALNNRALLYIKLGEYDKALSDVNLVLTRDPLNDLALNTRGLIYYDLGRYQESLTDFNRIVKVNPSLPETYNNRALSLKALGRNDEALSDFNKALTLKPDWWQAYNNRGNLKRDPQQYDEAIKDYQQALKIDASQPIVHYNLGFVYELQGQYREALKYYSEALDLNPEYTPAYLGRGIIKYFLSDLDGAVLDLTQVIGLDSQNNKAFFYRALTHYVQKDFKKAKADMLVAGQLGFFEEFPDLKAWYTKVIE